MLVLSRKSKESIMIGPDIEVRITKIEGDTVRLGIIAPREVGIYRKEILVAIEESNRVSALTPGEAKEQLKAAHVLFQANGSLSDP